MAARVRDAIARGFRCQVSTRADKSARYILRLWLLCSEAKVRVMSRVRAAKACKARVRSGTDWASWL